MERNLPDRRGRGNDKWERRNRDEEEGVAIWRRCWRGENAHTRTGRQLFYMNATKSRKNTIRENRTASNDTFDSQPPPPRQRREGWLARFFLTGKVKPPPTAKSCPPRDSVLKMSHWCGLKIESSSRLPLKLSPQRGPVLLELGAVVQAVGGLRLVQDAEEVGHNHHDADHL